MNKQKVIGVVLGVILFIILVASATYAYISWTSDKINRNIGSKCFDIYYDQGTDISGNMVPSTDYSGGLSASVKMNVESSCDINANGKLYLNTLDTTSSNLYREGLLNYQVLVGDTVTNVKGSIIESGEIELDLGSLVKSDSATTEYTIYVWIDNDKIENSDIGSVYYGSIRAEAIQYE